METFLIILGAIVVLFIDYKIAKEFQHIAEAKGFTDSGRYFWWTFLFAFVGYAMVITLPDLYARETDTLSAGEKTMQSTDGPKSEQLRKLKEMYDRGILTQEEFDAKKKQILGI